MSRNWDKVRRENKERSSFSSAQMADFRYRKNLKRLNRSWQASSNRRNHRHTSNRGSGTPLETPDRTSSISVNLEASPPLGTATAMSYDSPAATQA